MSTLAQRAAAFAQTTPGAEPGPADEHPASAPAAAAAELEQPETMPESRRVYHTPEKIPVWEAWNRVMQDVTHIRKDRRVTSGPAKFAFRGIEDVKNAFAEPMRYHGIIIVPTRTVATYTTSSSKNGTSMRECAVVVTYMMIGPMGDTMPVPFETAGEGADFSDKSTTKAQSISERTMYIVVGAVATDDPEPEQESAEMERGDPAISPQGYYAEITNPMTPRERFRQLYNELGQHRLDKFVVEHEGEQLTLGQLFMRTVNTRWPREPEQPTAPPPAPPQHTEHPPGQWAEGCPGCQAESAAIDRQG